MKIAIVHYSTYGHVATLAELIKQGIEHAGLVSADILQVPETLPSSVLEKLHAPPKPAYKVATAASLTEYDALVFGYPTRFGTVPAQMSEFLATLGGLWASGGLHGKPVAIFTSTSSPGGGQETTLRNFLSYIAHHGMIYVPLGYGRAFAQLTNLDEVHGGTPYGALTFAGADGSRQVSALEKEIAFIQGETFAEAAAKFAATAVPAQPETHTRSPLPSKPEAQGAVETEADKEAAPVNAETAPAETQTAKRTHNTESEKEKSGCCVIA